MIVVRPFPAKSFSFRADLGVATDEIGAVGLEGQVRQEPIAIVLKLAALTLIQPPLPDGNRCSPP